MSTLKFPNWKLGEKKTIKAKISEYENTVRQIDAKLGGGWTVEVDFGEFGSNTQSASSSYRKDPGRYIIQSIFTGFYSNDLSRMDQMSIDTVNNLVGSAKKLVYSCGPRSGSYQISNRLNISVDKTNGVKLTWNGDYFGYDHKENYFANWVDAQPGAVANAPFPGSWTAQQLKSIQSKQGTIDSASNQIKSKFGSDWDVQVDWEQFAANTKSASSSYQKDVGRYIVEEIFMGLASSDISRFTQDSVDGLNAHCAHKLKLTCGPRSSSYSISNRVNISADTTNGLVLQWNGDYFGYAWKDPYLFTWVDEQPSFAADPPYPGNWRLKDLKSLTQKKNYLETALSQLQAKCGAEWSFNVDWASICQNTQSGSSSYRNDYGRYVMDEIFSKWASSDLSLWDEDVAEAFNELAGDQHVITWKFGPRSGSYQISNRVNISIDESNGAVFEWNGDYFGYAWKEAYANKYILDNA